MDWPAKTSKHSQRKAARAHLAAVSFPCKQRTQAVYSRLGKQKCSTQPPPAPVSVTSTASAPALGDWSLDRTLSGSLPSPCVFISRHFTARATTCDGRAWRRLPGTPRTDRIYKTFSTPSSPCMAPLSRQANSAAMQCQRFSRHAAANHQDKRN